MSAASGLSRSRPPVLQADRDTWIHEDHTPSTSGLVVRPQDAKADMSGYGVTGHGATAGGLHHQARGLTVCQMKSRHLRFRVFTTNT
jgi:hypothetical protein